MRRRSTMKVLCGSFGKAKNLQASGSHDGNIDSILKEAPQFSLA